MSHTARKARCESGFTLIEVMIAITVLAVGMLAMASLLSQTDVSTNNSRYLSTAALLASEKLEELNQYPSADAHIAVTSGVTAGSLTADTASATMNYYDDVLVSSANGSIAETTSGVDGSGNAVYTTITQTPNGEITTTTSSTPASSADAISFNRRWLIEKDVPVTGVCRITVLVTLENVYRPMAAVKFQMSMVRQYAN